MTATDAPIVEEDTPELVHWYPPRHRSAQGTPAKALGAGALAAAAVGALALGALAIGALAIGRLAIGRISVGRARFKSLEVDELTVGVLRVLER
jgi:hypothetical protein